MLHPGVIAAKEKLQRGRQKLRHQHEGGSPGIQVCAGITELLDSVVLELYQIALADTGGSCAIPIAIVANGGYGRRDMAPYSDCDLMLLRAGGADQDLAPFTRKFTQHICDAGLDLGFSFRTIDDACSLALKDATIFTSLTESRFLCGDAPLYEKFFARFRRQTLRKTSLLINLVQKARRDERLQYGETVFLLNPNIKRSRGGLRDLQFIRWIGFARYGESDLESLARLGVVSKDDEKNLQKAREFLLRLRNELHFQAGKAQDVLVREEQLRIAEKYGYPSDKAMLAVERFMQDYFEHTSEVREAGAHFAVAATPVNGFKRILEPIFSHRAGIDFRVGPTQVRATEDGLKRVTSNPADVLRLMELANLYSKRIDDGTWRSIRNAMISRTDIELSDEARQRFLGLISQTGDIGRMLRRLHELRVLERIIPGMRHARCLMQFNEYHKYTVDEHSFRAVEAAVGFKSDPGPLGEAYRSLKHKRTLHLALLLHDLGKGFAEDHCEVGRRLAADTAAILRIPDPEAEALKFLVHKHLVMAHLAQYRDVNDDQVVVQFAVEVGSPEWLQMLFVLTCADMKAVGPNILTSWKQDLLTRLYLRTRRQLLGESLSSVSSQELARIRSDLSAKCRSPAQTDWLNQVFADLPTAYLLGTNSDQLFEELERLRHLSASEVAAWARYIPEHRAIEYSVGTYEQIAPGIFHRLTGALTSKGMQILSAEIHTLSNDLVLDRFYVNDLDFAGEPPEERRNEVVQALIGALKAPADNRPAFRRIWRPSDSAVTSPRLSNQVRIDNDTSERYTIIDVFAHDRMGLLYAITRTIYELGLSVHGARIGTHLDQVVDVFNVSERDGQKVRSEHRAEEIRRRLMQALEQLAAEGELNRNR